MAADIPDREVLIHRTALHFSDFPPLVAGHYGDWAPTVMAGSSMSPDDGARRASVILARAQRRDVLPNVWASLRSDSGLPAWALSR
jgi:hypothetical protein